jgi:2'-5' RNA ligase
MRLFIAINIPESLEKKIEDLLEQLRKDPSDIKWVNPKDIHITLKFLGEVGQEDVERLKQSLRDIAERFKRFDVELSGVGGFPDRRYPRVIWIGVRAGETLQALAREIEEAAFGIGIPKEARKFKAHLTLGRVRSKGISIKLQQALERLKDNPFGRFSVEGFSLIESLLTKEGPIYTILEEFQLGRI